MKKEIEQDRYLISLYDLEDFIGITNQLGTVDSFKFIDQIFSLTITYLTKLNPILVKSLGDSTLILFDSTDLDRKVKVVQGLKSKIENLIVSKGLSSKVSFTLHYGEALVGEIGVGRYRSLDCIGEAINTTFILNSKIKKGGFDITPELKEQLTEK